MRWLLVSQELGLGGETETYYHCLGVHHCSLFKIHIFFLWYVTQHSKRCYIIYVWYHCSTGSGLMILENSKGFMSNWGAAGWWGNSWTVCCKILATSRVGWNGCVMRDFSLERKLLACCTTKQSNTDLKIKILFKSFHFIFEINVHKKVNINFIIT